jgi:hypothetical protein
MPLLLEPTPRPTTERRTHAHHTHGVLRRRILAEAGLVSFTAGRDEGDEDLR